ncbi:esterase-like activity of phytase-domain-containing protein [Kockiozyma suomiensis]|uniref:esterase-like activity of phytase-domain-containing protein n=1 Tax=Kockiozyma suomiensis TaxID=1337062 RepID=UPI0033439064
MTMYRLVLGALALSATVVGSPLATSYSDGVVNTTTCGSYSYSYDSMVGYGFLAGNAVDNYGDTIGFGSSITLERPSVKVTTLADGSKNVSAIVYNLPDRGWNTEGTTNFEPRIYKFEIAFQPKSGGSFKPNLQWRLVDTLILTDPYGNPLTGYDCDTKLRFPNMPHIPAATFENNGWYDFGGQNISVRVCFDAETLNVIDGSIENGFWISDEYGPYLYRFNSRGMMVEAIRPPEAFIPYRNGTESFSADSPRIDTGVDDDITPSDPDSGRSNNQGFEGGTLSPDGKYIYALLQSATVQDGGLKKYTNSYSRMVKYDISTPGESELVGEWVVKLPTFYNPDSSAKKNPRTAAQSEIYALSESQFFVIARDSGKGHGQSDGTESLYRHIDVFDITNATDIHSIDEYNVATGAVAPGGVLVDGITSATLCPFLDVNVNSQLNKFGGGLHNGGEQNWELLNEKWEGMVLIPADGKSGSDDKYYVIITSDDDFMTQQGFVNFGKNTYRDSAGYNLDNQALVFEITLPSSLKPFKDFPAGS